MTTPLVPAFTVPSASGQLTNKHATNTGGDAISLGIKYTPQAAPNPVGSMRIFGTKPAQGGGSPITALDTWWLGAGTQQGLPRQGANLQQSCIFTNSITGDGSDTRLYVALSDTSVSPSISYFFSAPFNGSNVGTWRYEQVPSLLGTSQIGPDNAYQTINTVPAGALNSVAVIGSFKAVIGSVIARVGVAGAFTVGTATSVTPPVGQATTAGNLLVAIITAGGTIAIASASTGWVKLIDTQNLGGNQAAIWYKPNCGAAEAAPTFTVTTGSGLMTAQVLEFSGALTASPGDATGSSFNNVVQSFVQATAADAQDGDLVVSGTRFSESASFVTTFTQLFNNNIPVVALGNDGATNQAQHSSFMYGIGVTRPYGVVGANGVCRGFTQIGGYVYAFFGTSASFPQTIWYAPINGDGTFGDWTLAANQPANPSNDRWLTGWSNANGQSWIVSGGGGASAAVDYTELNADGSINAWRTTAAGTSTQSIRCGIYFQSNIAQDGGGILFLIGGVSSSSVINKLVATVSGITLTLATPVAATTGLPAGGRESFGFAAVGGYLYVIGGVAGGFQQVNIWSIKASLVGTTTWTTDAQSVGGASSYLAAGSGAPNGTSVGGIGTGAPSIVLLGNNTPAVQVASINPATGALLAAFANQSVGAELTNGQLGAGGVVTNNQDGSVSITYNWQPAVVGGAPVSDGDVITLTVQFCDQAGGDPSPTFSTIIKVGQPPSISAVSPSGATNNCQPTISFTYNAGAGGAAESQYQIQLKNNGGVIVADTGIVSGQANTYSPQLNPILANALLASTVITVYSADSPMPGSTNSAQATTTFTPTQTTPSSPTGGSVTVDNVGASITAFWTNPGGSSALFNRLYWRLSGTVPWNLAKDNITAVIGSQQSLLLMDMIPMGVAIDVAVSAVILNNPGTSETALVTCGTVTINPDYHQDLGGYTAFLHIQGQGTSFRVPLPNIPPIKFARKIDSEVVVMFGNLAPSIRYGAFSYREITLNVAELNVNIAVLDALLAKAQQGNVIVYRDTVGNVIYCGLPPDRSREIDQYYRDDLKLIEQQFTLVP